MTHHLSLHYPWPCLIVKADSLEAQIEQVTEGKIKQSAQMLAINDSLKAKISVLQVKLKKGHLTAVELAKVNLELAELK